MTTNSSSQLDTPTSHISDLASSITPRSLGRVIAVLIFASTTAVIALAPMLARPGQLTPMRINAGVAMVVLGLLSWFGPWDRYHRALTFLAVAAFGHMAMGIFVAKSTQSFLAFFVLLFAFTGVTLPRGTGVLFAPLAAAAWVLPVLARGGGASEAILALLYLPVWVVTGEGFAWLIARLRKTEAELRRLDRLKNEFIAMVAHDVRTPLTVIGGFADTLREQDEMLSSADRRTFLDTIVRNTKRCAEFIENLLQFARIEVGEFRQSPRPFDIVEMATRLAEEFRAVHGVEKLNVHADPGLPSAMADEVRQLQVLSNLLSNAVKFSAPDEPIDIDITRVSADLQVSVRDRGPGIREEDVPKLFQKFASLGSLEGPRRAVGTGLGLYISRKIVEAGGGRLWVETKPGRGATFFYTVPAAQSTNGDETHKSSELVMERDPVAPDDVSS